MPIGIFLFALKSEFQEKSHFASEVPENGEKRRKPEKISGFSVGIFLSRYIVGGFRNFAFGEYSHAQPLVSELPDGFGGECEPDSAAPEGRAEPDLLRS